MQTSADPWRDAQERGIDVRAIGQEPGWLLEIDHEGSMRLLYDYGEQVVTIAAPKPVVAGTRTTYAARTQERDLRITIDDAHCEDAMSGQPFPQVVTVTLGERELRGCGRTFSR